MKARFVLYPTLATVLSILGACGSDPSTPGGSSGSGGSSGGTVGSGGIAGSPAVFGGMVGSAGVAGAPAVSGGMAGSGVAGAPIATAGAGGATAGASSGGAAPVAGASGSGGAGGKGGAGGTGGQPASAGAAGSSNTMGPCDIYKAANNPCVGAYSTIRRLTSTYTGPLYQVRSGSSAQNTGSGGMTHDIGQTADGYADAAAQDAVCKGTFCTISLMYDQSGKANHLPVAKKGRVDGGQYADDDDFESKADAGPLKVAGRDVYSLFMEERQGYRLKVAGNGVPRRAEPQGIYMLADGTHVGEKCCWDFGNVTPDPTEYHTMNTLFFGKGFWGQGAGNPPWFMADFEAGVWAGGSKAGDPGWGDLNTQDSPPNLNNPSLKVKYAIGFLKTSTNYALRMADLSTATMLTTAYEGPLPKPMDNQGAIVIGVGGDNSNNSFGTFYEGAVVTGYPSAATEDAVMQNVKAAGYGR